MPIDLNQIIVNVNDIIPPDNFATVDAGVKTGTVYTKEQDNAWRKEVEITTQSGIKGVAKPGMVYDPITNPIPTPWTVGRPNIYEKYDVNEAGVFPNFIKINDQPVEVTSQELQLNEVQIWVNNGVAGKVLKTMPQASVNIRLWEDIPLNDFPLTEGEQVIKDTAQFIVDKNQIVNYTDIPGESDKWKWLSGDFVQNVTNNNYNIDPEQIVPTEALYNDDDETVAIDLSKRVDKNTGIDVNYRDTDVWRDGTPMNDSKVDEFAYVKIDGEFKKRTYDDELPTIDSRNVGRLNGETYEIPTGKTLHITKMVENLNLVFSEKSKFNPENNTLKDIDFTVTPTKKHTLEIDPDWFTDLFTDAEKIEAAFEVCKKFLGAAIKINRDYYFDRAFILEGGSVHIIGNAFPNFFPNENSENSANRKYDCNYNTSRLIANNASMDKIMWIKGASFGGFRACSVWIQGVAFQNNNDSSPIIPKNICDGIYIDTPDAPTRPFTVTKCDFFGLRYGIHIDTRGGTFSTGVGAININHNNMHGNIYGVKAQGVSAVLNFSFSNNNAEQNLQGAVDLWDDVSTRVANANINITNNMLEGQPVPIRIKASKSTITIEDNYFESSNLQTIIIRGNVIHTQVFFGKYYCNKDEKLLLDFTNLTYKITSRVFDKSTKIKTLNCLEITNNNISYESNCLVTSQDFADVFTEQPIKGYIPTFDSQYNSVYGVQNAKLMSPTNVQTFNILAVPLENGKKYMLSMLVKDLTPYDGVSVRRKFRVFNNVNALPYPDLDNQTFLCPSNGNEYILFCVFTHNFPSATSGLNIRFSGNDTTFDNNTQFSRVGIFEYNGIRKLSPKLDVLSTEPTYTTASQGYTYYNSTTNKLRIWKNTGFVDLI